MIDLVYSQYWATLLGLNDDPCDEWRTVWVTPAMTAVSKPTWLLAVKSFSDVADRVCE